MDTHSQYKPSASTLSADEYSPTLSRRSEKQIRTKFLAHLTYNKVWLRPEEKPISH